MLWPELHRSRAAEWALDADLLWKPRPSIPGGVGFGQVWCWQAPPRDCPETTVRGRGRAEGRLEDGPPSSRVWAMAFSVGSSAGEALGRALWRTQGLGSLYSPQAVLFMAREGNGTPLHSSCLESPMGGGAWWAAVHGVAKSQTLLSDFTFTFHFHALEKEMATHSSVLAWRIPGTGSLVRCRLWSRIESDTTEVT